MLELEGVELLSVECAYVEGVCRRDEVLEHSYRSNGGITMWASLQLKEN